MTKNTSPTHNVQSGPGEGPSISWDGRLEQATSIPSLFFRRCRRTPSALAYKYHAGGGWHDVTFKGFEKRVREVAAGLIALGIEPGDRVSVIGETRPEWAICDLAIMAVGAVSVGIYQTNTPEQTRFVIDHSKSRMVLVDTPAQLEKVRLVRADLPTVDHVVIWDPPADVDEGAGELSLFTVLKMGRGGGPYAQKAVDERTHALDLDEWANIIYTSGTTGPPKGAILSHGNVLAMLNSTSAADIAPGDITLSFLPMCHAAEKIVSFYGRINKGVATAFVRSLEFQSILEDIGSIRPTVFGSVPRIFEKVYARAQMRAEDSGRLKRSVFDWAVRVGRTWSRRSRAGERIGRRLTLQHRVADRLVYQRVRELFGGNVRVFVSGAAPIAVEILEFFHGAGLLILEVYGMTETAAVVTVNTEDDFRFGTVGKPIDCVELRIDDDGEILVRGANVFVGYYRDDDATRAALDEDGWLHTGDIGEVDKDGFLTITDRKKNIIITAGGKNIAPQNIENVVKDDPFIANVVVIGDRRPYLTALITLDEDELPHLAEKLSIRFRGGDAMSREPEVVQYLQAAIDRANAQLSRVEQIKRFRVLPRDLSIDDGELTPTLKVRRQVVADKYANLIGEMYTDHQP